VRFQVLTEDSTKMSVSWVAAPCVLIGLMTKTASTSETSVNFYQTIRRNNLEDSHLRAEKCF
jgi:hypothetical protein